MSNFKLLLKVTSEDRIDKYISLNSDFSRTDAKKLIEKNAIFVDGISVRKPNFNVKLDQEILIVESIQKEINAIAEELPISIIYEDDHLLIVNKKSGMVVHPAPGHHSGTLVNGLLYKFKNDLSDVNGNIRPGIVHRIDKDTSGLLIVAKNNETHVLLAEIIKKHEVKRKYLAWVKGRMENEITHIDLPIGRDPKNRQKMKVINTNSKFAKTHVYVKKALETMTLIECQLETGRTHQIRVHLSHIGNPIIGDPVYGTKIDDFGQRLHAYQLEFIHPISKKKMKFEVEPPKEFGYNV